MAKNDLVFDSNAPELVKPSQVMFHMLEEAVQEGRLGLLNDKFWSKTDQPRDIHKDIDDYIEHLIQEKTSRI